MSMHPSTVTEHLSSLTQDELIEHLFKNPVYLLNTCITVIEGILRVCGPQTVPNPQCNSDLRLAAALLDALDTHLGRVLRAKELSAQYVRNFWEACLSTEFPCTLLRFVSSPIFWTRTLDYRDRAFGCLASFMHIWWHGTVLEEEGDIRVRVPSKDLVSRIVRDSWAVWERVWQHRAQIETDCDADGNGAQNGSPQYGLPKYVQNLASSLVLIASNQHQGDDSAIRTLDSSKIAHVALWTWWFLPFGDAQPDNRALEATFAVILNTPDDQQRRMFIEEHIIKEIGADALMSKLDHSLNGLPDITGDSLSNSLYFMEAFSNANPELFRAYAKLPVSTSVARALKKEDDPQNMLPSGRQTWAERQLRRWAACAGLLINIGEGLITGIRAPTTVDGADIYSIFIHGILVAIQVARSGAPSLLIEHEDNYSDTFSQWMDHVRHYNRMRSGFPESVVHGLRSAARSNGYSVLLELRKASQEPGSPELIPYLLDLWIRLGEELGVDEEKMRKEYEKARMKCCSWRLCQYHTTPSDKALPGCKGCGAAFYCTRTCQVSDWKEGHKRNCRRLR